MKKPILSCAINSVLYFAFTAFVVMFFNKVPILFFGFYSLVYYFGGFLIVLKVQKTFELELKSLCPAFFKSWENKKLKATLSSNKTEELFIEAQKEMMQHTKSRSATKGILDAFNWRGVFAGSHFITIIIVALIMAHNGIFI